LRRNIQLDRNDEGIMLRCTINGGAQGPPDEEAIMAEFKAQVEQAANSFEKAVAEQSARFESAVQEFTKLQSKGIAQASAIFEDYARLAREQIVFAEQLAGEWRKVVLASTRSASDIFAPKA
jgi:hypothetical protein